MIFFLFLTLLIFCSFGVISSRNPIHSILFLVCVFMLSSILLFCLEIEFLGLSFILIYVGAIAILFLFVVMMLDLKINDKLFNRLQYDLATYFLIFFFFLELALPLSNLNIFSQSLSCSNFDWTNWSSQVETFSNIQAIGQVLYSYYFIFFLLAGFILFVSIIGSLMLTLTLNKAGGIRF
jgi:NADH-quinone oxidoreductase subunit J